MNRQQELLTYKILHFKNMGANTNLSDLIIEPSLEGESPTNLRLKLKNVCVKLSPQLVERLNNAISLLDMSKRLFIETALIQSLDEFDRLCSDLNIHDETENDFK